MSVGQTSAGLLNTGVLAAVRLLRTEVSPQCCDLNSQGKFLGFIALSRILRSLDQIYLVDCCVTLSHFSAKPPSLIACSVVARKNSCSSPFPDGPLSLRVFTVFRTPRVRWDGQKCDKVAKCQSSAG